MKNTEKGKKEHKKFNMKKLKYGSNSIILIAIVVALTVVVNMIVGMLSLKWDLTPNKLFSITDATKNIIKGLNTDITIYALTDETELQNDSNGKKVVEIINQYKGKHVNVKYVDPDKNPSIIQEISPNKMSDISKGYYVVKSDKRTKIIKESDMYATYTDQSTYQSTVGGINAEEKLSSAIKFVTTDKVPAVYFLTGHEEVSPDNNFGQIKAYMENNAFEVKTLNLLTEAKVPDDAQLLIVPSPRQDLVLDEKVKLKDYLKKGANVIFMFDPQAKNIEFTNFNEILNDYNINVNNDKVKETDEKMFIPKKEYYLRPNIPATATNVITGISNNKSGYLIMPDTRSISILKNENQSLSVNAIAQTSAKAVSVPIAGGNETTGMFNLAVSAEYKGGEKSTKLMVIGNSTFASDALVSYYGAAGLYFLADTMNWMVNVENNGTSIPIKEYENRIIDINQLQSQILSVIVVVVIPLIILVIGIVVWLRRRHL